MKHLILLLLLTSSFFCFSQDVLTFKSTSRVFNSDNVKLTSIEVRDLFASNPEALRLYNSGMTKKTLGNILLYGGSATLIGKFLFNATQTDNSFEVVGYGAFGQPILVNNSKTYSNTLLFVSAAVIVIAIPIKIGFSKKIKKAVLLMNQDLKNPKTGFNIESTSFISNSNGVGFSITF